jgi:hypothetical protein
MKIIRVVDVVVERKLVELSLRAVLELAKVVVQRPISWVGACNIAASRTDVSGSVPRTCTPSVADLGRESPGRDDIGREEEGAEGQVEPRRHHGYWKPLPKETLQRK